MATREYTEPDGTWAPSTSLGQELQQLKKLQQHNLSDEEICHRMVITKKQLRNMRKILP
jgi:hypothetical protein